MFRDNPDKAHAEPVVQISPSESHKIKQLEEKVEYLFNIVHQNRFQPTDQTKTIQVPFYTYFVAAGKPDFPPDDEVEHRTLSIDKTLLKRPSKCFALRVSGESMVGAGIQDGDIIIIEQGAEPINGAILVVRVAGEGYTVKTLEIRKNGEFWLKPSNPIFKAVKITPEMQASIIGRVVLIIREP